MTRICSLLFLLVVGVASIMDAQDNGRVVDEPPLQIAVVGDVKSPGAINYSNDLTLISAINAAGGYTDFGLKTKAYLVRDGKVTLIYPGDALKDEKLDVHLKPWIRFTSLANTSTEQIRKSPEKARWMRTFALHYQCPIEKKGETRFRFSSWQRHDSRSSRRLSAATPPGLLF